MLPSYSELKAMESDVKLLEAARRLAEQAMHKEETEIKEKVARLKVEAALVQAPSLIRKAMVKGETETKIMLGPLDESFTFDLFCKIAGSRHYTFEEIKIGLYSFVKIKWTL